MSRRSPTPGRDQTSDSASDRSREALGRDPSVPPVEAPRTAERAWAPSLLLVNTGDGKGKTTAALGTLLRAVARGWRVCVVQFMKSGDWKVGEEESARKLGIEWWTIGDGFTWESEDLDESHAVAIEAWRQARKIIDSGDYQMVLLDEVTYPINFGWIDVDEVVATLRDRPERTTVIVTGRDAPPEIIAIADTVTEMRKVKHAFDRGIQARRGIDY